MIIKVVPVLAVAGVLAASGVARATTPGEPVPRVMAALGDSISSGYNSCGFFISCRSRSWSSGRNAAVDSHYGRLAALGPGLAPKNYAVPGSTSADLLGQVRKAVAARADYVTVLIGAQDACTASERQMTPVSVYRQRLEQALNELRAGVPGVRVLVASIPDVHRLWRVAKDQAVARGVWRVGRICPSMLARPTSTAKADVLRRTHVRERVIDYNREAAEVCAARLWCRTDRGAVFSYPFTLKQVSRWDYFHPNVAGQKVLAELTFGNGFTWADPR
ncbi:GDSL-type esterase/lipase family protein [Nonomuraea harbinensis]|uniref:GDSL-type esterase/lipase family protein n=1 Tax=Nonomuraea harbinensis TaxID=1286938 RepID=A0ABW1BPZ8_9ACTN|nr:GDSL-type esterase/lipase family protein [Nonomuraea harbinensis]